METGAGASRGARHQVNGQSGPSLSATQCECPRGQVCAASACLAAGAGKMPLRLHTRTLLVMPLGNISPAWSTDVRLVGATDATLYVSGLPSIRIRNIGLALRALTLWRLWAHRGRMDQQDRDIQLCRPLRSCRDRALHSNADLTTTGLLVGLGANVALPPNAVLPGTSRQLDFTHISADSKPVSFGTPAIVVTSFNVGNSIDRVTAGFIVQFAIDLGVSEHFFDAFIPHGPIPPTALNRIPVCSLVSDRIGGISICSLRHRGRLHPVYA